MVTGDGFTRDASFRSVWSLRVARLCLTSAMAPPGFDVAERSEPAGLLRLAFIALFAVDSASNDAMALRSGIARIHRVPPASTTAPEVGNVDCVPDSVSDQYPIKPNPQIKMATGSRTRLKQHDPIVQRSRLNLDVEGQPMFPMVKHFVIVVNEFPAIDRSPAEGPHDPQQFGNRKIDSLRCRVVPVRIA